jgi:hypothetical protein
MREAVQVTVAAIERRAWLYRNTMVAVAVLIVGCPLAAMLTRSLWPLAGWLLSVPITALFLWCDRRAVDAWCATMIATCAKHQLSLSHVVAVIQAQKHLPAETVGRMLNELVRFAGAT